jgi:hypothetical protein
VEEDLFQLERRKDVAKGMTARNEELQTESDLIRQ